MTNDAYIALAQRELQRSEKSLEDDTRALLLLLLWRLRQSLIASLPDTGISRPLILDSLLQPFQLELRLYNDAFLRILQTELERLDATYPQFVADYAGVRLSQWVYKPRTGPTLLSTTRTGGTNLNTFFTPRSDTGFSPFMAAHLRAIRAKILTGLLRNDTTLEIARTLVAERTRRGIIQPINARGTTYSTLRNRDTALIANSVWDVAAHIERSIFQRQQRVTRLTDTPFASNGWVWNAVLDPATCPICRPLHNTRSSTYTGFPYIPPVHPRCRCRILPAPAAT